MYVLKYKIYIYNFHNVVQFYNITKCWQTWTEFNFRSVDIYYYFVHTLIKLC